MSRDLVSVMAGATVFDVAEILTGEQVSALAAVDDRGITVIVSGADLIRHAEIGTTPLRACSFDKCRTAGSLA